MVDRTPRTVWTGIALGGLVAGTVDIGAACVIYASSIPFILHSIAGGVLGQRSFELGAAAAWLGLALQEAMGILIAAIYLAVMRSPLGRLRRWPWWQSGGLFGVGVFFVMNYGVVPLSAWHRFPRFTALSFAANVAAMVLFGLIVGYFTRGVALENSGQKGGMDPLPSAKDAALEDRRGARANNL